ncbi:hypothetical protein PENSPDRAFT_752420 [Peniophora sp. CONT]|nr:hypothetical protein PENSPDRAFT_752420 [Peniophora sp. CONT]
MSSGSAKDSVNVSDLPAELLGSIFIWTADILGDSQYKVTKAPPCTYLSHVSRHWRNVALACQKLWSARLPRRSVEWTEICLSRCPSITLDVTIDAFYHEGYFKGGRKAAALVMQHWGRVRTLCMKPALYPLDMDEAERVLSEASQADLRTLFDFIAHPNENLEVLEFDFRLDISMMHDVVPIELPANLLSRQHPPRLRRLELAYCALPRAPPTQLFSTSLRTLKLYNTRAWEDIDSMTQYFLAMPMLEHFEYEYDRQNEAFDCSPSRSHSIRSVPMPHLKDIVLKGHWLQNIAIFTYIAVPSDCSFQIIFRGWDIIDGLPEDTVHEVIAMAKSALVQHFSPATSRDVFYSEVTIARYHMRARIPAREDKQHSDASALLPPELDLAFPATDDMGISKAAFDLFLSQPVLTRATRLYFNAGLWLLSPEVYEQYTSVRDLYLTGCDDVWAFASALRSKGTALFPTLSRVILLNLTVPRGRAYDLSDMADALRESHAAEKSFEHLVLEHCDHVTEEVENEMKAELGEHRVVRNPPLQQL